MSAPADVTLNYLFFHTHRGIELISCLFSYISWDRPRTIFPPPLFSSISWDLPAFLIPLFCRAVALRYVLNGFISTSYGLGLSVDLAANHIYFHAHRGIPRKQSAVRRQRGEAAIDSVGPSSARPRPNAIRPYNPRVRSGVARRKICAKKQAWLIFRTALLLPARFRALCAPHTKALRG